MKQKGDKWKKFENLEKDILKIVNTFKRERTISQIKLELEKLDIKVSWITLRNYLLSLNKKRKIKKNVLGRYTFWSKR